MIVKMLLISATDVRQKSPIKESAADMAREILIVNHNQVMN